MAAIDNGGAVVVLMGWWDGAVENLLVGELANPIISPPRLLAAAPSFPAPPPRRSRAVPSRAARRSHAASPRPRRPHGDAGRSRVAEPYRNR